MKIFKRLVVVIFSVTGIVVSIHDSAAQTPRPNIIFILADDLGWSSLSERMDPDDPRSVSDYHETPNLARLAARGMRLTRGYASAAICSPSRRSILFGQTPARQGDERFAETHNPLTTSHETLPVMLKKIDPRYRTAHYGKWDMRAGFSPEDAGYDESDGDTGNRHGDVISDKSERFTAVFAQEDPKRAFTLAQRANNFMERQVRQGSPFYLQISHYATHVDVQAREATLDKFANKVRGEKDDHAPFAAMLHDLDNAIGQVLAKVEALGIADNTYIFFMADNGGTEFFPPVRNRLDHPDKFGRMMRNYPLRGGKWTLYEGGIRVPFIVAGPGIRPGSSSAVPVTGWDLLPTFRSLAGGKASGNEVLDGGSFADILKNAGRGKVDRPSRALVFHRYNNSYPHSAIIDGDYKLIRFWKTGKTELYNLAGDPGERTNIIDKQKNRARTLEKELVAYLKTVNPELIHQYKTP